MDGRVERARTLWQSAYDTQPMTLGAAQFGVRNTSGPRPGSIAFDVINTLEQKEGIPLTVKGITADIASRRPRMSPKKQHQLEANVMKSVQRLREGGFISIAGSVPNENGHDTFKYQVATVG